AVRSKTSGYLASSFAALTCAALIDQGCQSTLREESDVVRDPVVTTSLAQAASMQSGTWAELATSDINATLTGTIGGATGNIIPYSDELVWNSMARKVFFLGGDHKSNPADTRDHPRFVSYTDSTNTWQREPDPPWLLSTMNFHAYDHH